MFCKNCGKELGAKSSFCPICGEPTDIVEKEEVLYKGDIKPVNQVSKMFKMLLITSASFMLIAHLINFFRPIENFINYNYGWNFRDCMMMNAFPVLACSICALCTSIFPFKQRLTLKDDCALKYLAVINYICSIAMFVIALLTCASLSFLAPWFW